MTRVQVTPKATGAASVSVAPVFSVSPAVGSGIIFISWGGTITGVTDNYGNTYSLAKSQATFGQNHCWFCPKITTTGAGFTVTGTGANANRLGIAIEISGVGTPGLAVNQSVGAASASTTPSTGNTAALTADEVVLIAAVTLNTNEASITGPAGYTQEVEQLTAPPPTGEADSRIITGALGSVQSAGWSYPTNSLFDALLVAFNGSALPAAAEVIQTVIVM